GAVANNGLGGTGIAPGVTIVPIKADAGFGFSDAAIEDGIRYALQHNIDITNNSYGPGDGHALDPLTFNEQQLFSDAAIYGRNGKGMINVFASGNDGDQFGFSNYQGLQNSRYVIGVTGVDENG